VVTSFRTASAGSPMSSGKPTSGKFQKGIRRWYNTRTATERGAILNGIIVGVIGGIFLFFVAAAQGNIIIFRDVFHFGEADNPAPVTQSEASGSAVTGVAASLQGGLQIVDVGFVEPELGPLGDVDHRYPQLDVKLRNTGGSVAFLKRATFRVTQAWKIDWPQPQGAGPGHPTWDYDVDFPKTSDPFTVSHNLSQIIDPNGIDRFTVTLGEEGEQEVTTTYVYLMTIDLIHDEDSKVVSTRNILVMLPPLYWTWNMDCAKWFSSNASSLQECQSILDQGKTAMKQISSIDAVRDPLLEIILDDIMTS
jgi:hypothetical protein